MALKKIGLFEKLQPGDRLQVVIKKRFSLGNTFDTVLLASRLSKLEERRDWYVERHELDSDGNLIVDITVKQFDSFDNVQQAGVITSATIIAAIVGVSIIFLSVTAYKIVDRVGDSIETPAGKVVASSIPVIAIAAVLFVLYLWLRKK